MARLELSGHMSNGVRHSTPLDKSNLLPWKYSLSGYLASGGQDWPPLDKSNSPSGCFSGRGAQPPAEPSLAERSEASARSAVPREARPPPKAAGAEGAPELREGFKRKQECDPTGSVLAVAYKQLGSAGKRALHVRDTYC